MGSEIKAGGSDNPRGKDAEEKKTKETCIQLEGENDDHCNESANANHMRADLPADTDNKSDDQRYEAAKNKGMKQAEHGDPHKKNQGKNIKDHCYGHWKKPFLSVVKLDLVDHSAHKQYRDQKCRQQKSADNNKQNYGLLKVGRHIGKIGVGEKQNQYSQRRH